MDIVRGMTLLLPIRLEMHKFKLATMIGIKSKVWNSEMPHTCIQVSICLLHLCLYVYTNAYAYTYIYIYKYTYKHTSKHAYKQTSKQTNTHTYIHLHTHICMCIHLHMHVYIRVCVCVRMRAYIHMCIHTYMHTYVCTCTRIYTHTHIKIGPNAARRLSDGIERVSGRRNFCGKTDRDRAYVRVIPCV